MGAYAPFSWRMKMRTIDVTLPVAKETYELGLGIVGFLTALKRALEDGFQIGDDLPMIISEAVNTLIPSVSGFEDIAKEIEENRSEFINAVCLSLTHIIESLAKDAR